ncbi:hypothetical protein PHET_07633 [Paragonimus heterotremus]|uniref:Uncharacterized protein n=1 Tax=Paragonimus heterotremus TaxID=100268 RepID=A0A8J4SMR7_9TREM|nr:hypothetical protein PHET_07633 [Paragonimus heterotremus]
MGMKLSSKAVSNQNSQKEKWLNEKARCVGTQLLGWTYQNALLSGLSTPSVATRQLATINTSNWKSDRSVLYNRLLRNQKEFKFYHYDDPRAYIIQYRRDCSSVATVNAGDGPLEMFKCLERSGTYGMTAEPNSNRETGANKTTAVEIGNVGVELDHSTVSTTTASSAPTDSKCVRSQAGIKLAPITQSSSQVVDPKTTTTISTSSSFPVVNSTASTAMQLWPVDLCYNNPVSPRPNLNGLTELACLSADRVVPRSQMPASHTNPRRDGLRTALVGLRGPNVGHAYSKQPTRLASFGQRPAGSNSYPSVTGHMWNQNATLRDTSANSETKNTSNHFRVKSSNPWISSNARTATRKAITSINNFHQNEPQTSQRWKQFFPSVPSSQGAAGDSHREVAAQPLNMVNTADKSAMIRDGSDQGFGKLLVEKLLKLQQKQGEINEGERGSGESITPVDRRSLCRSQTEQNLTCSDWHLKNHHIPGSNTQSDSNKSFRSANVLILNTPEASRATRPPVYVNTVKSHDVEHSKPPAPTILQMARLQPSVHERPDQCLRLVTSRPALPSSAYLRALELRDQLAISTSVLRPQSCRTLQPVETTAKRTRQVPG